MRKNSHRYMLSMAVFYHLPNFRLALQAVIVDFKGVFHVFPLGQFIFVTIYNLYSFSHRVGRYGQNSPDLPNYWNLKRERV